MSDIVFNQMKGKVAYYAGLPAASDALIVVPIQTTGIESDAVLQDYDDVAALLAASNDEQATMGRKTVTSGVTVTIDDTNNRVDVDMPDLTWTAATGNAISALVVSYDNDTTGGTDANLVPMVKLDAVVTPAGGDITYQVNASGFFRAA